MTKGSHKSMHDPDPRLCLRNTIQEDSSHRTSYHLCVAWQEPAVSRNKQGAIMNEVLPPELVVMILDSVESVSLPVCIHVCCLWNELVVKTGWCPNKHGVLNKGSYAF